MSPNSESGLTKKLDLSLKRVKAARCCMLEDLVRLQVKSRAFCWTCRQPAPACYCARLKPFDPEIEFAILIHKIESRRRIATGRMSHLILERSHLIEGEAFDDNPRVQALLQRDDVQPVILYPGPNSTDISCASGTASLTTTSPEKRLLIFVVDGTWATARRTMRVSTSLNRLPRISFSPIRTSQFLVRKQPADYCLSTLEAIHHTIELLGESQGYDIASRRHDHLLEVFSSMVDRQLQYVPTNPVKTRV